MYRGKFVGNDVVHVVTTGGFGVVGWWIFGEGLSGDGGEMAGGERRGGVEEIERK